MVSSRIGARILHGAESEKIVPSDHGANQNPEAIAEVIRILKEHVAKQSVSEGNAQVTAIR